MMIDGSLKRIHQRYAISFSPVEQTPALNLQPGTLSFVQLKHVIELIFDDYRWPSYKAVANITIQAMLNHFQSVQEQTDHTTKVDHIFLLHLDEVKI